MEISPPELGASLATVRRTWLITEVSAASSVASVASRIVCACADALSASASTCCLRESNRSFPIT